jgi:hypothetical protein
MTYPSFISGEVLRAADMNAVGLWLVKTQTVGTAVSSVTVTGAFSADYDRYLITVENLQGSAIGDMRLQLGSTTTGYYGFIQYGVANVATLFGINQNNAANFGYVGSLAASGTGLTSSHITINNAFNTTRTYLSCPYFGSFNGAAFGNYQGMQDNDTSFTAFTLIAGSGTMSGGTISVYGYKK